MRRAARCHCWLPHAAWSKCCPKHAAPGEFAAFVASPEGQEWCRKYRPELVSTPTTSEDR